MAARKTINVRIPHGATRSLLKRYGLRARVVPGRLPGVQVWSVAVRAPAAGLRGLLAVLPRSERAAAFRRRYVRLRRGAVISFAMQRLLLAQRLQQTPRAVPLIRAHNGKPRLRAAGTAVHFSASHADGVLLVALGGARPLGIDIESAQRRLDPLTLGRQVLGTHEYAELEARPEASRNAFFLRLWTRKEAAAKADGRGLALGLSTLDALSDPRAIVCACGNGTRQRWQVRDLAPGGRRIAALATLEARK